MIQYKKTEGGRGVRYSEEAGEIILSVREMIAFSLFRYVGTAPGEELLPAVPEFVIRIDTEEGIFVRPIPGLLDGGAEA